MRQLVSKQFLYFLIEKNCTLHANRARRGARRSIIGGGHIFIYLCSHTVKTSDFKI